MPYRVDNVPWFWRPFWLAGSWIIAAAWGAAMLFLNLTCRVHVQGAEKLAGSESYIYSYWHRYLGLWFVAFLRSHRNHVWLQHPLAYMKPVHILLRWMGVRILLGSSGDEGRRAAETLTEILKSGASTMINPDGPRGPAGVLKKGVLHISLGSGVPIVPVRLRARPAVRLPTWEGKLLPLPFARIDVTYGEPIRVTAENFDQAAELLADAMGA